MLSGAVGMAVGCCQGLSGGPVGSVGLSGLSGCVGSVGSTLQAYTHPHRHLAVGAVGLSGYRVVSGGVGGSGWCRVGVGCQCRVVKPPLRNSSNRSDAATRPQPRHASSSGCWEVNDEVDEAGGELAASATGSARAAALAAAGGESAAHQLHSRPAMPEPSRARLENFTEAMTTGGRSAAGFGRSAGAPLLFNSDEQ